MMSPSHSLQPHPALFYLTHFSLEGECWKFPSNFHLHDHQVREAITREMKGKGTKDTVWNNSCSLPDRKKFFYSRKQEKNKVNNNSFFHSHGKSVDGRKRTMGKVLEYSPDTMTWK